jgi:hypothetical protein
MKTKQLIATAAMLIATGAAFAQQTDSVAADANFVAKKTRAEVIAELKQAQANGVYAVGGEEFPGQVVAKATRSRSDAVQSAGNKKPGVSGN